MRSKNFFLGGRFRTFNLGTSRTRPRFDSVGEPAAGGSRLLTDVTQLPHADRITEPPAAPAAAAAAAPAGRQQPLTLAQRLKLERAGQPTGRFRTRYDPRVLAKYDVKALVGRGTYSRVVRAESRLTRRPVAIKMVDISADKSTAKQTFDSELRILRKLRHPNVIQLVEVGGSPRWDGWDGCWRLDEVGEMVAAG